MSAIATLQATLTAGLSLRVDRDGRIMVRGAPEDAPPDLLTRLRAHKPELLRLLRGDLCRQCAAPIDWPRPVGVVFADGLAAHLSCYEQQAGGNPRATDKLSCGSTAPGPGNCQTISEISASLVQLSRDPDDEHFG